MAAVVAEHKTKYDRQLRIWGDQGQAALEKASICLLNCGPTGTEALKNLVLGGIGSVTVVDGSKVEPSDLGNNFLLDEGCLGQSRAKSVCSFLQELNDAVKAKYVEESPVTMIDTNPSFFSQFTVIICTQLPESSLLKLDDICRSADIVLVAARSYGLTGLVRVSVKEHCVIESKPDHFLDDLRLHNPWTELKQFAKSIDICDKDPVVHKHTPYIVILVRLAEKWADSHDGHLPSTRQEKKEYKTRLRGAHCSKKASEFSANSAPLQVNQDFLLPAVADTASELRQEDVLQGGWPTAGVMLSIGTLDVGEGHRDDLKKLQEDLTLLMRARGTEDEGKMHHLPLNRSLNEGMAKQRSFRKLVSSVFNGFLSRPSFRETVPELRATEVLLQSACEVASELSSN